MQNLNLFVEIQTLENAFNDSKIQSPIEETIEVFNDKDIQVGDIVLATTVKKVNNYFHGHYYAIVRKCYASNLLLIEKIEFKIESPKNTACKVVDLAKGQEVDYRFIGKTCKKNIKNMRKWNGKSIDTLNNKNFYFN
jgi:hypothetical protein